MMMNDSVLARVAALRGMPTPELKLQWQQLFDAPPPPYNRRFLESRLAYRIQELAYGGLKPETVKRLEAMGEQLDGGNPIIRRIRTDEKPIAGTSAKLTTNSRPAASAALRDASSASSCCSNRLCSALRTVI